MSNMKIAFWHNYTSGPTNFDVRESSFTVGTLRSTFHLAATDTQELFNAMWNKGMRPCINPPHTYDDERK